MGKILVVEDMKPIQLLLEKRLTKEKHEAVVVNNGKEALAEVLSQDDIDLILLDIMMPHMSGIEFLEQHYDKCKEKGIKVCMLTALEDNENIQKCLSLGASDYLIKPIDNELLLEKLETLLTDSSNARFAAIKTDIPVRLIGEKVEGDGKMIVLSENKAIIETSIAYHTNTILQLESNELEAVIKNKFSVTSRVVSSKIEKGSYAYLMEFVGLSEKKTRKIRELTISGQELNLSSGVESDDVNSEKNKDEE